MKHEITNRDVPRWRNVFRPLLNIYPIFASVEDKQGKFALHYACEKQAPDVIIQDLIDLNDTIAMRRSRYGWLPLHYGIHSNLGFDSVRIVLESYVKGATQKDLKWRYTPFHMGLEAEVEDNVMYLLLKHAEEESKKHCHACAACALLLQKKRKVDSSSSSSTSSSVTRIITRNRKERERWIREAKAMANRVSVRKYKN